METRQRYEIHCRYMMDGAWVHDVKVLEDTTMTHAWGRASGFARGLDEEYGNSHFWTVDLTNPKGESYVQLFHGRLS
jgi:hypothetical protein